MKNFLRTLIYVILPAVMLAGCDVHELPEGESNVLVTLNLKFNTDLPQYQTIDYTKANSEDWQLRYIVRLYKYTSDTYDRAPAYTYTYYNQDITSMDCTLPLLAEAANYRVLVWADYIKPNTKEDVFYNTADFGDISLLGDYCGAEIMRDCFYGGTDLQMAELLTYDSVYEATVELGRPLARFNFISTDKDKFIDYWVQQLAIRSGTYVKPDRNSIDLNQFHVRYVYPQFLPNTFSLHTDKPVDSATGIRFDADMSIRDDGMVDLGFDWMFVNPTESKVIVSLEIYDQDWSYVSTINNIEVPLMRSQQTTIQGNILTSGINSGISIDPTYDGEFTVYL